MICYRENLKKDNIIGTSCNSLQKHSDTILTSIEDFEPVTNNEMPQVSSVDSLSQTRTSAPLNTCKSEESEQIIDPVTSTGIHQSSARYNIANQLY